MKEKANINVENLNKILNFAYDLGRENENRDERGIPLLNPTEEFQKMLDKLSE